MKRSNALLSALIIASSIAVFQAPAQAGKRAAATEVLQRGGSAIRKVIPKRVKPSTARRQVEACIRGYRTGPNKVPLPTARNLCARLKR